MPRFRPSVYGGVLLLAAAAYHILVRCLLACHGAESALRQAIGTDFKGRISVALYALGIPLACWLPG